jgi:hypothetical protein
LDKGSGVDFREARNWNQGSGERVSANVCSLSYGRLNVKNDSNGGIAERQARYARRALAGLSGAVDFRTINSGGKISVFSLRDVDREFRRASKSSAAHRPIASVGSAMTVNGGSR